MKHKKCGGRVFLDRIFSERNHIELFCLPCGTRWMINKNGNRFAAWLEKMEMAHETASL